MHIFIDFDIILISIFITIFITGYIRGGGIELLRVLKVIIPFFVLYFYGDEITNILFSSDKTVKFVYKILPDVTYRNTIAALSTQIGVYIFVYSLLAIFLWRLGKYVLDERIEYVFGKFNSILGGIFSIIRMYIIVSVLIIPFYAFNFTNHEDKITSFVLNNPPSFSKIGRIIDKSKPTIDKINDYSSSIKIMDLNSLEKYTELLVNVKDFIDENEAQAQIIYKYLDENQINDQKIKSDYLYYYVKDLAFFKSIKISDNKIKKMNEDLLNNVTNYEGVVIWAYENDIKNKDSIEEILDSFIYNYPQIAAKTNDKLTIDVLAKVKLKTQIYLILKSWLETSFDIKINNNYDFLMDDNLEKILNEYHLYKDDLIYDINNMSATTKEKNEIIEQLNKFTKFQEEYLSVYKLQMEIYDKLLYDVSFKNKLIFSIAKDKNLNDVIINNVDSEPLIYIFILDSVEFLNLLNNDNNIYYSSGQVYVALFLLDLKVVDNEITYNKISYEDLSTKLIGINKHQDIYPEIKIIINKIIYSLLNDGNQKSYFEKIIQDGYVEDDVIDKLLLSKEVKDFLTDENYNLLQKLFNKIYISN